MRIEQLSGTKASLRTVDGKAVRIYETEINDANMLKVSVGTNGPCGGDSGHGARTYFALEDLSSTDMRISINGSEYEDMMGRSVEFIFGGDAEIRTLLVALKFAVHCLEHQLLFGEDNH